MSGKYLRFVGFLLILLAAACRPVLPENPGTARDQITFMAGYKPQANLPFVGVYVAEQQGFFAEENLQVNIQHSSGQGEHLQLLTAGEVQVTTQDAAVLLQRRADPGLPLVSIALIGQRGQQAYAALQSAGIHSPLDWEGRLVGYKGTPPADLFALLAAAGADPEDIDLVNVGFDPRVLTEGQVDVYPVYKSNEPYLLESWGYELTLWEAADYGVPMLGLAYVTSEDTLAKQPDLLARFLRAALRGIAYAAAHPQEAVQAVMVYAGEQTDPQHMSFMLQTELEDAQSPLTEANGFGWQTAEQWQSLADMLIQFQAMSPTDPASAFTTRILELARDGE
jgi:ABC-type nitrate/sulfonate/bicarbonate transport system substrate-binding protein